MGLTDAKLEGRFLRKGDNGVEYKARVRGLVEGYSSVLTEE